MVVSFKTSGVYMDITYLVYMYSISVSGCENKFDVNTCTSTIKGGGGGVG